MLQDNNVISSQVVDNDKTHLDRKNPHLREKIESHVGPDLMDKYSPWIYFPCSVDDLESFYEKRKTIPQFVDKMYFRGTSISDRPIVTHFNTNYLNGYTPISLYK